MLAWPAIWEEFQTIAPAAAGRRRRRRAGGGTLGIIGLGNPSQ